MNTKVKDITAQNQFTAALRISDKGIVTIEDTSSMSMTVTLQVRPVNSNEWIAVSTATAQGIIAIAYGGNLEWRVGVPTGGFTSGTATVTITG
jgi:hypothetical protein